MATWLGFGRPKCKTQGDNHQGEIMEISENVPPDIGKSWKNQGNVILYSIKLTKCIPYLPL